LRTSVLWERQQCWPSFLGWSTAPLVFCVLLLEGLLAGVLEIGLNVEIDRGADGRGVMNRAYGFWSLGFFATALASPAIRQAEIPMSVHLAMVFVSVAAVATFVLTGMTNAPARPASHQIAASRIAFPTVGLLPLCIVGSAALLLEGAGIDWSTIYMRDAFDVEPFVGGLALTCFTLFMGMTRLFADRLVDRYGPRRVMLVLLIVSAAGIRLIGIAPHPSAALLGFCLIGSGCSAIYPLTVSAAAQRTDQASHVNVAALAQMGFVIFFLGPPLLGFAAEHAGIHSAYLVCLPLIAASLLYSGALGRRQAARAAVVPHNPVGAGSANLNVPHATEAPEG